MRTDQFREIYHAYITEVVRPFVGQAFYYQRIPGIRLHLSKAKTKTVQYHTDEWYGHGENVINFWSPLTHAYETNTLYLATLSDSYEVVNALEKSKADMNAINDRLRSICTPLDIDSGETICFCARVAHGAEANETPDTRVSIDYRVLLVGDDPGSKPLGEYYEFSDAPLAMRSAQQAGAGSTQSYSATSYIYPKHGFTKHVSQHQQRLFNQDFAAKRGIQLVAEETEIKTMSHHPMLLSLAAGHGAADVNAVLSYSVCCLPEHKEDRVGIYNNARKNKITLFFANEGLEFPTQANEEKIEAAREKYF